MSPVSLSGGFTATGQWTSQTLTNSLGTFRTGYNGYWGELSFQYEGGDANSSVKVDILSSANVVLLSDITLSDLNNRKRADLSVLPSVRAVDIKIRIRLKAQTKSPVISDITLLWADTKTS